MKILPSREKCVSEITPEDTKVRIIGVVVDVTENSLVIDDGTGKLEVILGEYSKVGDEIKKIKIGSVVRVIARLYHTDSGTKAFCDVIQECSSLDVNLYKEMRETIERAGVMEYV